MDYQRIYDTLISYRRSNIPSGYTERHHIQMRSLGGLDDAFNIVELTAREHYIAHLLLARFNRCSQTITALHMMSVCTSARHDREIVKTGRMYEWVRREYIKYITGRKHTDESKAKISKANLGKKRSAETKARIKKNHWRLKTPTVKPIPKAKPIGLGRGRLHTDETKRKMSLAKTGRKFSIEHKANMSAAQKRRHASKEIQK